MIRHWQYLKYVLRHKWFVFLAGLGKIPLWMLILHDWDKFLPSMWFPYSRTFYAADGTSQYKPDDSGMSRAWNDHQKRNKHHWQYWLITWDSGKTEALLMPDVYRREMIADWVGAGRAQGKPKTWEWYEVAKHCMILHPNTRSEVEKAMFEIQQIYELEERLKKQGII